jgi:hypothetical protein
LAVYRQSFHIGAKRLKVHDQNFFHWTLAVMELM